MRTSQRRTVEYRIDPFDLHLFTAVVAQGSITAAAGAVHLSLAAASARLQGLEEAVGARLLARSKAGAQPTDAGRALLRHAHRVLSELESLHAEMASFGPGLRGTVRLLCNTAALSEALPRSLGSFLLATPDLDVEVQELPSEAVIDALRRGTADLGIVADYVDTAGLRVQPWLEDCLVALVPRNWAWGRRRTTAFADLLAHPWVGLAQGSGLSRFLAAQARRSGRVPRHRVRLGDFAALAQLVAAGVGVAVMPLSAALRHGNAQTRVIHLSDGWSRRKLLICMTEAGSEMPSVCALAQALRGAPGLV